MNLTNKSVLLTGATGGLGLAIAEMLTTLGAKLTVSGRRADALTDVAAKLGASIEVADLARRDDVDRLADVCRNADVLIANAGLGQDSPIESVTDTETDVILDVNLRAPIVLATAFAQGRIAAHAPGQIVMIGSLSGLAASPQTRLYNATKFGLRGYSLALRQDLEPFDIGVTYVAPGFIRDAGMFHNGGIDLPKGTRTKAPSDVASGVVKAIHENPPEVFVSPIELRLAATLATVAPGISAKIQKRMDATGRQQQG